MAGAAAAVEAVAVEVEAASRPSRKRLRLPQPKESFRTLATRAKPHPQKSPTEKQSQPMLPSRSHMHRQFPQPCR